MRLVNKYDDWFGRRFDFVNHAFETPFELPLDAGTCLQQSHVQSQQFDIFEHLRHFTGRNTRGQPFNNCGFTHARLAHHNRVIFSTAGQNVDHLTNRVIAAQHRIKFAVAGLLGQVVREALKQRFARYRGFTGVRLRLERECKTLQTLDVQFAE